MTERGSDIGTRLRSLREERGLSQRALIGPGVSAAYISRIENGQRLPSVRAIRTLARALGVSPEFLETGHELGDEAHRELRVAEAEVRLRLGEERGTVEEELRHLLKEAEEVGDSASTICARIALGSAAVQRAAYAEAIEVLEGPLACADIEPAGHPEAYAGLAQSYVGVGNPRKAVELIEAALARIREAELGDPAVATRFATYLSFILSDIGDTAGARAVLDKAFQEACQAAEPHSRVRLHWSRARLAQTEGQYKLAQAEIRRAIALLDMADDARNLARAHLLYAESVIVEGLDLGPARAHIDSAEQLLDPKLANHEVAWLSVLKASVFTSAGAVEQAQICARRALELLGEFDHELRGRAEAALADALMEAGQDQAALEAFERADRLLEGGERRFRAQLFNAWSTALERQGRLAEALALARRGAAAAPEPTRQSLVSPPRDR